MLYPSPLMRTRGKIHLCFSRKRRDAAAFSACCAAYAAGSFPRPAKTKNPADSIRAHRLTPVAFQESAGFLSTSAFFPRAAFHGGLRPAFTPGKNRGVQLLDRSSTPDRPPPVPAGSGTCCPEQVHMFNKNALNGMIRISVPCRVFLSLPSCVQPYLHPQQ